MADSAGFGIAVGGGALLDSHGADTTIRLMRDRAARQERNALTKAKADQDKENRLDNLLKDFKVDYSNSLPYWANKKRDIVAGFVRDYMKSRAEGTASYNEFHSKWQTEVLPQIAVIEAGNSRAQDLVKAASDPQQRLNINADVVNTIVDPNTTDSEMARLGTEYGWQGFKTDTQGGFDWRAVPKPDLTEYFAKITDKDYGEVPLKTPKETGVPGKWFVGSDFKLNDKTDAALMATLPNDPYLLGQVSWDRKDLANNPDGLKQEAMRRANEAVETVRYGAPKYQIVSESDFAASNREERKAKPKVSGNSVTIGNSKWSYFADGKEEIFTPSRTDVTENKVFDFEQIKEGGKIKMISGRLKEIVIGKDNVPKIHVMVEDKEETVDYTPNNIGKIKNEFNANPYEIRAMFTGGANVVPSSGKVGTTAKGTGSNVTKSSQKSETKSSKLLKGTVEQFEAAAKKRGMDGQEYESWLKEQGYDIELVK